MVPHFFKVKKVSKNNSGIIIIIVMWVLVILTTLAMSLGRNTTVNLSLTKHQIAKTKADYFAWAGVLYAIEQIRLDSQEEASRGSDTLYYCGRRRQPAILLEDLFKKHVFEDGHFDVQYSSPDGNQDYYGFQDEERRFNINGLTLDNVHMLSSLIVLLGFEEKVAETIAYSMIDWEDQDTISSHPSYGAEDDYYLALSRPYHCKNMPFDSLEETLLVRGMTKEVFTKLKDYITIFPKQGQFLINIDTAPALILEAFTRSLAGPVTNTQVADADSLVNKMLEYRRGEDRKELTPDDRVLELNDLSLNAKEQALFLTLNQYRTKQSNYFRIQVKGVEDLRGVEARCEAIVDRNNLSIVQWHRN